MLHDYDYVAYPLTIFDQETSWIITIWTNGQSRIDVKHLLQFLTTVTSSGVPSL